MLNRPRALGRVAAISAAFLLAACGGDPARPDVPPAVTVTAATSPTIMSGNTVQLAAQLTDRKGDVVTNAVFTWSSADPSIASVSPTGLVRGTVAGTTTLRATAEGTTGSLSVTVTPGPAVKLAVATQPAGAASGVRFTTQPVVEIRDAAENVVTTSGLAISTLIFSGTGALSGTQTVTAVQGVARFTDLALAGPIGAKVLQFFVAGIQSAESAPFAVAAGAPAAIAFVGTAPALRSGVAAGTAIVVSFRDNQGNETPVAGRRVVASVTGGSGVTSISGTAATSDASGRAVFSTLTVAGVAGVRTLRFTADDFPTAINVTANLIGGRATRVIVEREPQLAAEVGIPLSTPPSVRLVDSVGNNSNDAQVQIRATAQGGVNTVTNDSVRTDTLGRATFTNLAINGSVGSRTLLFTSGTLGSAVSRAINLIPADTTTPPAFINIANSAADTSQRVVLLATPTSTVTPYVLARDAQRNQIGTAGVRWFSRDPSRVTVSLDGRITGVRSGRAFVVAQANRTPSVADSVLVFVPANATGPILRATLPSYRVTTDTFSIIVQIESRDGGSFSAANLEVAWPGDASFPFSPFTVSSIVTLRPGVVIGRVDAQENVRVTWASATPVVGTVQLVRLICRVNQRNAGNQLVLTLNQLLAGDLSNVTAAASVFNPIVIIP